MRIKKWIYSNEDRQWSEGKQEPQTGRQGGENPQAFVGPNGQRYQKMNGFGGCFNEQGYAALGCLAQAEQDRLLRELFAPGEEGCNLTLCRMPIGANDYSFDWYSLNETPGDYGMKHFSLERDRRALIPYIRRALSYQPGLKLFASPWSPPAWMKNPPVYNWGKLIKTEENLKAYALYFRRFLEEYEREGIRVHQVHVQNEPVANQKFPSCMWTGEELGDFIKGYLGPELRSNGLDTEIWLGTINAPGCDYKRLIFDKWATEDYDYYANTVLMDGEARKYIAGVSYQWGGKIAIQRTYESWGDEIRLMQSENECGFGDNTWEYARYVWTMLKHYISNGAESYQYWNLVLKPEGVSTWGDPQNAMITVKPDTKEYVLNPDFYVMKHFSNIVKDGAVRLGLTGTFAADTVGFQNPDGSYAFVLFNPFTRVLPVELKVEGETRLFSLPPQSINSIVIEGEEIKQTERKAD
jgi:glucosylceramidase